MHHKMAFFEGGKGRHIKLFHDRHAKLLSNIYNLYTFDDLEKKQSFVTSLKSLSYLTYFRTFSVAGVLQLYHVGPLKVTEGQFLLRLQHSIASTLRKYNVDWTEGGDLTLTHKEKYVSVKYGLNCFGKNVLKINTGWKRGSSFPVKALPM